MAGPDGSPTFAPKLRPSGLMRSIGHQDQGKEGTRKCLLETTMKGPGIKWVHARNSSCQLHLIVLKAKEESMVEGVDGDAGARHGEVAT